MSRSAIKHQPFRRQNGPESGGSGGMSASTVSIVAVVIVVVFFSGIIATYIILRRLKAKNKSPKFIPSSWLKKRWESWQPKSKYRSVSSAERAEVTNVSANTAYTGNGGEPAPATTGAGVDRNTSVRSVMTLPAYSQAPKETEQVIGREGERGGMDTVVEFPETVEEEEAQRETEMESLYQIRLARRREIAEREERRRERREARERGDTARLEEIRRESRQRSASAAAANGSTGNLTADTLIAEHNSRPKERRVSSVAYGALGQVRHDGTRLRANSTESETNGLLDGAAPMGEHGRNNSDATSLFTVSNLSRPSVQTGRHRSDSGAASLSTNASSIDLPHTTPTTTNTNTNTNDEHRASPEESPETSPSQTQFTPESNASTTNPSDNAETRLSHPPEYELHDWGDAPDYEEAVRRRESQRIERERLNRASVASRTSVVSGVSAASPVAPQTQLGLGVPRISVHLASEPVSPVLPRVSEDQDRNEHTETIA